VFVNLGCDAEPYWNAVHCVAGVNLFRKGPYATRFVEAWLEACLNPYSLTDLPNRCGLPDLEGFVTHRHDQAVLSVLVAKYTLETYRYPTKWGNFVKMPAYRVPGEEVVYPYHLKDIGGQYSPTPKLNSPYGTIFQVNREIPGGSSRQTKLEKVTSIVNTQKASLKNRLIGRFFKYMYKVENRIFSDRALPSGRLHAKAKYARLSFSQCGEDLLIDHIFKLRGIRHPSYLDIGAFHPWRLSNTAYFYLNGSRGVNVEPNPNLILAFHNERPLDVNLNVGIGEAEGVLDFYEISDRTLSTFSKKEADACAANGQGIAAVHQVQVITLANVLAQAGLDQFPDFLSLDVEGLEEEILRGLGTQHQYPKVICVETAEYSPTGSGAKRTDLIAFIERKGYYLYADTNLNSIFVKNEFWFV
jgi:FkbM family methyltransferase